MWSCGDTIYVNKYCCLAVACLPRSTRLPHGLPSAHEGQGWGSLRGDGDMAVVVAGSAAAKTRATPAAVTSAPALGI